MMGKTLVRGQEAREKILNGVNVVDEVVGGTLGPSGRNVLIQQKYRSPAVYNDGVTIARHISLEDQTEDLGAQILVEAALKSNETVGDGTTTTVVLAAEVIRQCFERIGKDDLDPVLGGAKANPMALFREIQSEKDKVLKILESKSRKLEKDELINVVTTSLEDKNLAKMVVEMIEKLGKDAHISVVDNWATKYDITPETITGFRDYGTYCTPYCINTEKREAIWEGTPVLVFNHQMQSVHVLANLLKKLREQGIMKLAIFSSGDGQPAFDEPVIKQIAITNLQAAKGNSEAMRILGVKVPSMTTEQLTDLACFTDSHFFNKKLGEELKDTNIEHLGFAEKIVVNEDEFVILGGRGNTEQRIQNLQKEVEAEKDIMFKNKLERRIASLSSGVGIIRVGAPTEPEREYLRLKLEDAVNAAKAALEEGVVKGGGECFREIAEELGESSILYTALKRPYERIRENHGGDLAISDDVLDPTKVERLALINACSAAGTLITSEAAISYKDPSVWEEMAKKMNAWVATDDTDFRSVKNQDKGAGRIVK